MLATLDKTLRVLAKQPPASSDQVSRLIAAYPTVPDEYLSVVKEATEVELQHQSGQYVRIWGPDGCIKMDDSYDISKRIASAIPIGDDRGCKVIFYMNGEKGFGLYHVGYGDLDADDAVFAAPSLSDLLEHAVGLDTF
jgi:hypothetical protein